MSTTAEQMLMAGDGPSVSAVLDFVSGTYVVNGESVAVGALIDQTGRVIPGSGLEVRSSTVRGGSAAVVNVIHDPLQQILFSRNWTCLVEYENLVALDTPDSFRRDWFFYLYSGTYASTHNYSWLFALGGKAAFEEQRYSDSFNRSLLFTGTPTSHPSPAVHRAAFTLSPDHMHVSHDGSTPTAPDTADDASSLGLTLTGAVIADSTGFATAQPRAYIRAVTLFVPRKRASTLAVLTAP